RFLPRLRPEAQCAPAIRRTLRLRPVPDLAEAPRDVATRAAPRPAPFRRAATRPARHAGLCAGSAGAHSGPHRLRQRGFGRPGILRPDVRSAQPTLEPRPESPESLTGEAGGHVLRVLDSAVRVHGVGDAD